jgi:phage N-6-adenine-methyltransferase
MNAIQIDPEFQALIPPLRADERAQLEANIVADGVRDPLVTWQGVLIDGHNRYEIATRLGLPYQVTSMDFATRDDACDWIDRNQLGRRNLHPLQFSLLVGRIYNRAKKAEGGTGANQHTQQLRQSDAVAERTSERIARQHGLGSRTVERAGQFADAIEKVREIAPHIEQDVAAGLAPSRRTVIEAAALVDTAPEQAVEILTKPHVAQNSGNNEWYTPVAYVDAARRVMGAIDLDPASSAVANRTVQANAFYTIEDDGLAQDWPVGRIWMNPPYAQPLIGQFCERLANAVEDGAEAIALVNNATETAWFQRLGDVCAAICFPRTRIRFLDPLGNPGAPLQGQAIVYCGWRPHDFAHEFKQFGLVVYCG